MPSLKTSSGRVGDGEVQEHAHSPANDSLLQSLLTTLANLDLDYERERERVSSSTNDDGFRARALRKLEEQHRERRDPYIRYLEIISARVMPTE